MKPCSTLLVAVWLAFTASLGAQDALTGDFSKPQEVEKRLAAVRTELRELPAGASQQLREQLQQLEAICQYHLAAVGVLTMAKAERDKATQAKEEWRGYPPETPRTVLLLDDVRETLASLANMRSAGEAQLRIFTSQIEAARDRLAAHQQALRRFTESADKATTPEARQSAGESVKIEMVASRIAAEEVARHNLRAESQRTELAMIRSKSELGTLQLASLQGKVSFPRSDLDDILKRIASERSEAVAALTASGQRVATPNPLLAWKIEFLDLEKEFWNTRFEAFGKAGHSVRSRALASFKQAKAQVDDWIEIGQLRLTGGSTGMVEVDPAQLRDMLQRAGRMQRRIGFAIADLEGGHLNMSVLDRILSSLRAIWDTELYLAQETDIVDGKTISTYRAVTLGKLVRLALILVVGWLALRFLARRVKTIVARKSKIAPATADLSAKWAFAIGIALLVIYGLNAVRIPLTALAFLGGALAIGVGFGTQTLIKNFISGLMLILERPLKVGDVIEVAGTTGEIKSIGIRASVIQHFDGIDTLIPNSVLLENQLTNWTYSNTIVRHFILVGVAYGSPTREVAKILLQVAHTHGLVLDEPSPEVRFEDFGDNALLFRLLFWLDTKRIGRDPLASDLRFMIDKAFAEAGIVIAFPQRDIHFDRETPLRIELSRNQKSQA